MAKIQEKFAESWKELAQRWRFYTPPARPSQEAIRVYREFVKQAIKGLRHRLRALVQGATPELRDLLAELKCEVTVLDINWEMILAMTKLTKKNNPSEIIMRGDWAENPLASNYYDVVVGDGTLSNVPKLKQKRFLQETQRLLRPGGYWLTRMAVIPNDWQKQSLAMVLDKYAKIPLRRNTAMEIFFNLHNNVWNPKTGLVTTRAMKRLMAPYQKSAGRYGHPNRHITRYLNDIWQMWRPMTKAWCERREQATVRQITPYFTVERKVVLHDCYYHQVDETMPVWLCKVRK